MDLKELCEGFPEEIQQKIKGAYWLGCAEGIALANTPKEKVERQEGNVVYLHKSSNPEKWVPPEL